MSKIEYAKFQFMILVLKSLALILVMLYSANGHQQADSLITEITDHEFYILKLTEEK